MSDLSSPPVNSLTPSPSAKKKKTDKKKDDAASSDEERWLEAIESGNLEEVDDELKKIKPKDPKLMTARQRAMLDRKSDAGSEQLLSLPSGYREKIMTPEMVQKAALKSQKRKQQADEKREKDKQKTMERLLKKQESKSGKIITKKSLQKKQTPSIKLVNTAESTFLSFPTGMDFPLKTSHINDVPVPSEIKCIIESCSNKKKYSCSKTGLPLCSLQCYKLNLQTNKLSQQTLIT